MRYLLILVFAFPLAAQQPRTVTPGFVAVNAASFGAAALDVALTQRCIRAGTCHESNPLMKGSAGRMYGIALGMSAAGTLVDYELEKRGHKEGRVIPWVVLGAHGFGAGMALRF